MRIFVPTPLRSYTGGKGEVQARGSTLAEALQDLDRTYPGIRFRMIDEQDGIRQHIKVFINREQVRSLGTPLAPEDEIQIICALSGGASDRV